MEQLKSLHIKRNALKRQLQNFCDVVNRGGLALSQLQERYERAPEIWSKFEDVSLEVECKINEVGSEAVVLQEHINNTTKYEAAFYEIMAKTREMIDNLRQERDHQDGTVQRTDSQLQGSMLKIKLPPLTIHPFSGDYDKWLSFKDAFEKVVHSQKDIPDVQKFQILRGLLKDSALKTITALEATNANYAEAWKLLQNRFSNKRIIINTHVKGLFELPTVTKSSQANLRNLVDTVRSHMRSLNSLGQPVDKWDTLLIFIITDKLDSASKEEWERDLGSKEEGVIPVLDEFLKFLEKRCLIHEMTERAKGKQESFNGNAAQFKQGKKVTLAATQNSHGSSKMFSANNQCGICGGQHFVYRCETFLRLSPMQRFEECRRRNMCMNCLKVGHQARNCVASSCRKCTRKHSTLLHREKEAGSIQEESSSNKSTDGRTREAAVVTAHCLPIQQTHILLSTALVYVGDSEGNQRRCRALIDPGSQVNLMTEDLARKLKLHRTKIDMPVSGVSQAKVKIKEVAEIVLNSTIGHFTTKENCLITATITERIPQVQLSKERIIIPNGIALADPDFCTPGTIDLLIGAGLYWKILSTNDNIIVKGKPSFQKTKLGWIAGGEFEEKRKDLAHATCHLITNSGLQEQLEKFWAVEEVTKERLKREEDEICEDQFQKTHTRDESGKFVVNLPQDTAIELGESFDIAMKRLESLERRFSRQPKLREDYTTFLKEYEEAGHMLRCIQGQREQTTYCYLPHHPIIKEGSISTKLRVVFDASAKTTTGKALNDRLMAGPNLQKDITHILIRFRLHEYVFTADIKAMFRLIWISDSDRNLQSILWREDPSKPVEIFTLNTVTYGLFKREQRT